MESLLKDLKKQVTCSICLDTYTEPKTISCLHTFCRECLEKHARVSQRQGKFRCPECQAEIDLPEGNRFDRFPNSFFYKSLLSLLAIRQSGDASSVACSHCRKTNPQMYYCFDCGRFLCLDCFNAHQMLSVTFEGHKVMPVKDFKGEDYEALLKRQPFCSQQFHEREITRFFCSQCQVCICSICIVTDHQNHNAVLLDKAAHDEKETIMSGAKTIKEREIQFCQVIKEFEEMIYELERNFTNAKREVSRTAEQMIANIRQREREAVVSLETTRVSRLKKIAAAKQEVESLIKQISQAAQFAENLVQRSSSSDIMQNKEALRQKFQELREVEVPKHRQTTFVQFNAASQQDFNLGFIQLHKSPTISTVEGLDQTFQAGVEAELTLCQKTPKGEISNQADLKDQVEFLIKPTKHVTNVTVQESEDGNLKLKFTPKVPGAYSVEVKIYDEKLPSSPFTLAVKERQLVVVGELNLKSNQGQEFKRPTGIAVNRRGDIAVVDNVGHCIFVFNKEGNFLKQIGIQGTYPGQFIYPNGVLFLNNNEILVADQFNNRIQHINVQTGTVLKTFGKEGEGKGDFKAPCAVHLDDAERIVVTEFCNNRVQVMSKEGETLFTIGDRGPEKLRKPYNCIPYKNIFMISEKDNHIIKAFDSSGTFLYKIGKEGNQDGHFNAPKGMCLDGSNNLLVCDFSNNRVQQFSLDGRFTGKSTVPLYGPLGIVTAPDGRILVTSPKARKIYILR